MINTDITVKMGHNAIAERMPAKNNDMLKHRFKKTAEFFSELIERI